jgi:hypothetical protein
MIANNIKRDIIDLLLMGKCKCSPLFVILILKKDIVYVTNNFFKKLSSFYYRDVVRTSLSEYYSSLLQFSTTHARLISA